MYRCVEISTKASIREMIFPALLSILAPLCVGLLMGLSALTGLLAGALATGYLLGVMMNNAGGAWDNAKKYIEAGNLKDVDGNVMGKKSEWHKAAVAGDTVGDPFKDTSGPSLNILIKLMTVFALVFTPVFKSSTKDPSALLVRNGGAGKKERIQTRRCVCVSERWYVPRHWCDIGRSHCAGCSLLLERESRQERQGAGTRQDHGSQGERSHPPKTVTEEDRQPESQTETFTHIPMMVSLSLVFVCV